MTAPKRRRIEYIVVHHNGVAGRTIEDIRRTHTAPKPNGNGWKAIGYHWVIHEDGSVHVGRPEQTPGAHVKEFNARTIGVCLIGNGNVQDFNEAQYAALVPLLRRLCNKYGIDADRVIGHRETRALVKPEHATSKTCPGTKVALDALRARVAATELVA